MHKKKQPGPKCRVSRKVLVKDFTSGLKLNEIALKHHVSAECVRLHMLSRGLKQYERLKRLHKENGQKKMLKMFLDYSKKLKRVARSLEARREGIKFNDLLYKIFRKEAEKKGLVYHKNKKPPVYSDQELINDFKKLAQKLGHTPTVKEIIAYGKYSYITYRNRFGSLTEAATVAGLMPNMRGGSHGEQEGFYITEDDCTNDLERITFILGHFPSSAELKKYGKYCYDTYRKRLGGIKMLNHHLGIEKKVA